MYNGKDVPCNNCTERKVRCHTTCTKYKEFSEKRKKELEESRKQSEYTNYVINQWKHRK